MIGQKDDAKKYLQNALVIRTEIGDRGGEAADYGNLGTLFMSLGQYNEAIEYFQKALVIRTEIGERKGEATDYVNLGAVFESLGQHDKAEEYFQKALVIGTEIGDREGEASVYGNLGVTLLSLRLYTTMLKSISRKRLLSELKLTTGKERHLTTETLELCLGFSSSARRL